MEGRHISTHGVMENGHNLDATQLQDKYEYQIKTYNFNRN
ncbi:hypothetical protein NC651_003665 [Populus alba x Populus x berolinensis]|uniref:Uncharacterized protein n=1 Tax=Populus alba x Populus x berolinensis TaxID=444605 RepID=A0AAD6RSG8_9ROSI|nr:hypothetical protein NC651_003657 [Populus alba x Populus x berolinensis]KAJ6949749.1 hypothetical protein NC651_003662 [Populus alba x Populus x berolinensis]KAJ6949753.1 hypothetical protein NC651_003665 [Populus alba x Populus x berolinensis]KAJ7014314.1 hypothetical protein NC653_003812 [Populus alba x Populus x berolinensis]KAJ7014317.1 hypothetical protein NC653_003815 [Populus alba x Populus x berolinensis]